MKKTRRIYELVVLLSVFALTLACVGTYAYYEYYGNYSSVININGTIKLDAFDVLYPELRGDDSYGVTPENPYIIDNVVRLQSLIKLNNSGKLKRSKTANGKNIAKYYFCLQFDAEEVPQVLNLLEEGLFSSIGTNDYPFEDELAGIVYAYTIPNTTDIVYYSGCAELVTITNNTEYDTTGAATGVTVSNMSNGVYLKLARYYDEDSFESGNLSSVEFITGTKYIYYGDVVTVHQMIANETIVADEEQLDVGFISRIAATGNVHDIILYNTQIQCEEETANSVFNFFSTIWEDLVHNFRSETRRDERHIGIFAGHIDGSAGNISVGGSSSITVNTKQVNYYSEFTTVGYIFDDALINGHRFADLVAEGFQSNGNVSGFLFADDIYALIADTSNPASTDADGAKHYTLQAINANLTVGWPGVTNSKFTYGTFNFVLSYDNDTISTIWNNSGDLKLLGDAGYTINGSVLYCENEYRYSPNQQSGGSLIQSAASVSESKFAGIQNLKASGSVLDSGKYLIVAKVADNSKTGGYAYYALKIKATSEASGDISYSFDFENHDVTNYLLDTENSEEVYMSALWEVDDSSSTPIFQNCRYDENYLSHYVLGQNGYLSLVGSNAENFSIAISNNSLYFTEAIDHDSYTENRQYFVNFNSNTKEFYISTSNDSTIEVYHISNGYTVREVKLSSEIKLDGDYLIVARNGSNSYLIGANYIYDENSGTSTTDGTIAASDYTYVTASIPNSISLDDYEGIKNYVWKYMKDGNGTNGFAEKASLTYFLGINGSSLALSTDATDWTYTQITNNTIGARLSSGSYYLSYSYDDSNETTDFGLSTSPYTLYFYQLVPEDSTPLYITYEGAKYIDANSTTIDEGTYAIIANVNGTYYALGLSNSTTVAATNATTSVTGSSSSLSAAYQWTVSASSATPTFKNNSYTSYYLHYNSTTAVNGATTSTEWMYDASNYRVYCMNGGTKYYLVYNGGFKLTNSENQSGSTYEIRLYRCDVQHTYTDFTQMTNTNQVSTTSTYVYFISTTDITDTSTNPYIVGYDADRQAIRYMSLSQKYTYSGTTLTTIYDLDAYTWKMETSDNYYFLKNVKSSNYLAVSSNAGTRILTYNSKSSTGTSGNITRIKMNTTRGFIVGFVGGGNTYYMINTTTKSEANILTISGTSNPDPRQTSDLYYYRATKNNANILTLISSDGDSLEEDIHYVIAAKDNNNRYNLLTRDIDDNGTVSYVGTEYTNTVSAIINATNSNGAYTGNTMVPRNADWTQIRDSYQLQFYHTSTSTNASKNYLTITNNDIATYAQAASLSTTNIAEWHYDIVNKVLYGVPANSSTKYYVTYNSSTRVFGLSTVASNAANIHVIRYTPTYTVTQVKDLSDDSLATGNFIIAGHTAFGYFGLKADGSTVSSINVTPYLKSKLSETEYESILEAIWSQKYYDWEEGSAYSADNNGNIYLRIGNLAGTGGFVPLSTDRNLHASASSALWRVKNTSEYLFQMINGEKISGTNANSYAITFTGSGAASLTIADPYKAIGNYLGNYGSNSNFDNTKDNIYLYNQNGNVATSITNNTSYLLMGSASGLTFILKRNNNSITLEEYNSSNLSTYTANNSAYLWTATSAEDDDMYYLANGSYYLYLNDDTLAASTTRNYPFVVNNGKITYFTYNYYTPYRYSNTALRVEEFNSRTAKLYTYSTTQSGGNGNNRRYSYTFTPVTDGSVAGSNRVILVNDGTNYYYVRYNNRAINYTALNDPSANASGVVTSTTANKTALTFAEFTVAASGTGYTATYVNGTTNYYVNMSSSAASIATSTTNNVFSYDTTHGIHAKTTSTQTVGLDGRTSFEAIASIDSATDGATVAVYKYNSNNDTYTQLTTDFVVGETYVIYVLQNAYYYRVGYDSTNNTLKVTKLADVISHDSVTSDDYFTAYANGPDFGVSIKSKNYSAYLNCDDSYIYTTSTVSTYWEYKCDDVYSTECRLFTVTASAGIPKTLAVQGNQIVASSTADTYLYSFTENNGVYTLGSLVTSFSNQGSYAIVIFDQGCYYLVTLQGDKVVPTAYGSGLPTTIENTMIWKFGGSNGALYISPRTNTNVYIRLGNSVALVLSNSNSNSTWNYTVSNSSSTATFATTRSGTTFSGASELYIFKVSKDDSMDEVSDATTKLSGKTLLTASLSIKESTNYVIAAQDGDKYYSFSMYTAQEVVTLDITDTMNTALAGGTITLFDASVWTQLGSDYNLIFDNQGFSGEGYFLLNGDEEYRFQGDPVVTNIVLEENEELTDRNLSFYTWKVYTFDSETDYLLGNQDEDSGIISYLVYNPTTQKFGLTTSAQEARAANHRVQIYQLGADLNQVVYETFQIALKEDGFTIDSYPLNEATYEDISQYTTGSATSDTQSLIAGEYMIMAVIDNRYYALSFEDDGSVTFRDASLLFSGNFLKDSEGNYCISINRSYLWKQTAAVTPTETGVSNMLITNLKTNEALTVGDSTSLTWSNGQITGGGKYLSFSVATGFDNNSTSASPIEIKFFSVGTISVAIGENELQYSFFTSPLNTDSVTFDNFTYTKTQMGDLPNYALDEEGTLGNSTGWKINNVEYLTTINSSIYFDYGIAYNTDANTFADTFVSATYNYEYDIPDSENTIDLQATYYVPKGAVGFVVSEASVDTPIFVKVIVSTELSNNFNADIKRYLAMWKMGDLTITDGANPSMSISTLSNGDGTASDYASTLISKFYTPDAAIPLPNHYGSVRSGASRVKVTENSISQYYDLSELNEGNSYDHLIAHTFTVSEPGVYYIGSTYGTVTFCYVSIDDMLLAKEGEDNTEVVSEQFSIDFVWGEVASSGTFGDNSGLGTIAYVSRNVANDASLTWVCSGIYPELVNGTAGQYTGTQPTGYNPTDEFEIMVTRDYNSQTGVSTVHIVGETTTKIYDNGYGIMYKNSNTGPQRLTRKVTINVTLSDAPEVQGDN